MKARRNRLKRQRRSARKLFVTYPILVAHRAARTGAYYLFLQRFPQLSTLP